VAPTRPCSLTAELVRAVALMTPLSPTAQGGEPGRWGQYFTPPAIAEFMASHLRPMPLRSLRVLDPGAGGGVLGIAAAAELIHRGHERVHLVAVEPERNARAILHEALELAQARLGTRFSCEVLASDYLDMSELTLESSPTDGFDVAVGNPPYFKLPPGQARGGNAPNIYARFMDVTAQLLVADGQLCFIVPRSYASGCYYKAFRKRFHNTMHLDRVHVFGSRRDAFRQQGVLQENVIVFYSRGATASRSVLVSSSDGVADLDRCHAHEVPLHVVFHPRDPDGIMRLPLTREDVALVESVDSWPATIRNFGIQASTGPVVPFRARQYLLRGPGVGQVVPLLWMQHVRRGAVSWPLGSRLRKPEYLSPATPAELLVPGGTYVLLRRFSAKEDARRLVAAVFDGIDSRFEYVGIENHLNYLHRSGRGLDLDEAHGLAALLNSELLDRFFRIANGNTQVSAAEIRSLRLPRLERIRSLGREMTRRGFPDPDSLVQEVTDVEGG
jgi:adenine-specific DNA-methyltransferase